MMDETKGLVSLLREFMESDEISNYDSKLCWGCNEPKAQPCLRDCLLERARQKIEHVEAMLTAHDNFAAHLPRVTHPELYEDGRLPR